MADCDDEDDEEGDYEEEYDNEYIETDENYVAGNDYDDIDGDEQLDEDDDYEYNVLEEDRDHMPHDHVYYMTDDEDSSDFTIEEEYGED